MAATLLAEVPYRVPMFTENGSLHPVWAKWFRDLYKRVGEGEADLVGAAGTDHGGLTGLLDDDHTQYLNTTRHDAISGNPHDVTITQSIAADSVGFSVTELETLTDGSNADSLHTHVEILEDMRAYALMISEI